MRVQAGNVTLPNNAAIGRYLRVKLTGGFIAVADADDRDLGTLEGSSLATDPVVAVIPDNAEGTRKCVAAGAIAQYAEVFKAAGGKVDASGTVEYGVALEAASGDGSYIEVLRFNEIDVT